MKVKIFEWLLEDYMPTEMEEEVNKWFEDVGDIGIIERKQSVSEYYLIISIWYQ